MLDAIFAIPGMMLILGALVVRLLPPSSNLLSTASPRAHVVHLLQLRSLLVTT